MGMSTTLTCESLLRVPYVEELLCRPYMESLLHFSGMDGTAGGGEATKNGGAVSYFVHARFIVLHVCIYIWYRIVLGQRRPGGPRQLLTGRVEL